MNGDTDEIIALFTKLTKSLLGTLGLLSLLHNSIAVAL
jgi:hypothetical protein